MATERGTAESSYDGRLFELYTKYVTEPESKQDVYGYTLVVIGYVLAMGGLFIYLVAPTGAEVSDSTLFLVRQVAAVPSAMGLILALLGIVLLLPVTRWGLVVAVLGALLGLAAVVLFVNFYPYNWHQGTPSYSNMIIGLYTAGIAIVAGIVILVPVITGERSYFSETTEGSQYDHPDIMVGNADRGGLFALFRRETEWTWRFIDQSAIAAASSSHLSRLEAEERVDAVKTQVANASLLEIKNAAFRLYEGSEGNWQWYLMRDDGSAVADGGTEYDTRDGAEGDINTLKDHSPDAEVFVLDDAFYDVRRSDGQWTWRLVDADRNPLATGVESHTDRDAAGGAIQQFRDLSTDAMELVIDGYGVELYEEDEGWTWRLRDSAHRHLATSTTEYERKGIAEDAVYDLLDRLQEATLLERGEPTYDVYRTGTTWQWRLVDDSGDPVARGEHTGDAPDPVTAAAGQMKRHVEDADVVRIENLEFETYRASNGWGWRLVDEGRNVHARSPDTYEDEQAASAVVDRVRTEAPEADLIEFDNAAFQVYEAEEGAWRWRLIDEDGNELADSGQGEYESKDGAMHAMTTLRENAPDAEHLEIENAAFELFQDDEGWGWRLVDDIGDTIADGVTRHETEDGAREAMNSLINSVSDVTERRMERGIFQLYTDEDDEWWWQYVQPDGSVLADSTASFGTRHEAESEIEDVQLYAGIAPVKQVGRLAILLETDNWTWNLVDEDRDFVAVGRLSHDDRQSAISAIKQVQNHAGETTVYEIRDAAFDCYRDDEGWTWRLVDERHDQIAHATRTYDDLPAVESTIEFVSQVAPDAEFLDYDNLGFELYRDDEGWTWRLVDDEQRILAAAANHYESIELAETDVENTREDIADASVIEIDSATFEFHLTDEGWRWRLVDDSGGELAESINAFPSRADAQDELTTVKELGPDAWVSHAE